MRIMVVDPGFDYSTLAVAESYSRAFEELGFEIIEYDTLKSLKIAQMGLPKGAPLEQITEYALSPILNQVLNDRIDVVLMVHGFWMNPSIVVGLRNIGCKVGLILTDDPMQVDRSIEWSKYYDYVFTNDRNTLVNYGKRGHYLPVAVDDTIFNPQQVLERYKSQVLIGGSFYKERIDFIQNSTVTSFLKMWDTTFVGAKKIEFENSELNRYVKANKISYEEMAKYVAGTELCIDIPRNEFNCRVFGESNKGQVKASSLSPRMFECFVSKTPCLTSDVRKDIVDLFPNINIPTYKSPEDMVEKGLEIKQGDLWDYNLIEELYSYTLNNHTYKNRVQKICEIMNISHSVKDLRGPVNGFVSNKWEKQWEDNFNICKKSNWYIKDHSIENIKDVPIIHGDTVDIISNGPSLERLLSHIFIEHRRCRNTRFFLNDALKFKNNCGYAFHHTYSIVIHPNKDVYDRCFSIWDSNDLKGIDLICSTLASTDVINKFSRRWFFNTGAEQGIKKEVFEYTKYPILCPGLTVGFSAIAVAAYLGFKQVNLYGLDFCYTNNKKYAFEELKLGSIDKKGLTLIEDAKGRPVITDLVMLKSRDIALKFIEDHPDIQFNMYGEGLLYSPKLSNLKVM